MFITFEGIEGCGKTTQVQLLEAHVKSRQIDAIFTREPGGTKIGDMIRSILLNNDFSEMSPLTELFLYEAARAQIVEEIIRPNLEKEKIVICDRYLDATSAYQGYGRGLDLALIQECNRIASGGIVPDITFLLDCSPEIGLSRAMQRIKGLSGPDREDRFEREHIEFHRKVREGYLLLSRSEHQRFRVINSEQSVEAVHQEILSNLTPFLQ